MAKFPERVAAALALMLICGHVAADDNSYLFSIPAGRTSGDVEPLGDFIEAVLHVPDASLAAEMILDSGAVGVFPVGNGQVSVTFGKSPTIAAEPNPNHGAASFVVDYEEDAVLDVVRELRKRFGDQPAIDEMSRFVFGHIDDKTYIHDFRLASKVAATGSGDCTEHAVLLTALARATGRPARVVLGVVLIGLGDSVQAYGHAWSEIHDGTAWRLADATLPEEAAVLSSGPYYLPLMALEDEGPGYSLDMLRIARMQPSRISDIANAPR